MGNGWVHEAPTIGLIGSDDDADATCYCLTVNATEPVTVMNCSGAYFMKKSDGVFRLDMRYLAEYRT